MFLAFLYQALNSPQGIVLRTPDPDRAIKRLRNEITRAKDADLASLSIIPSRTTAGEIWLIKRTAPNGNGE